MVQRTLQTALVHLQRVHGLFVLIAQLAELLAEPESTPDAEERDHDSGHEDDGQGGACGEDLPLAGEAGYGLAEQGERCGRGVAQDDTYGCDDGQRGHYESKEDQRNVLSGSGVPEDLRAL